SIFFFGGEVLRDFSFTLLVGMISGIYSTIYIASPLVIFWHGRKSAR
ncbi:MAG: protein translocase subunit SecF, partial [Candidatus Omnitrophica bacterium]|nr:protein translocase subunit SecF [Candidatus Omnitrophota bacterium]